MSPLSSLLSIVFTLLFFCALTLPVLAAFVLGVWWRDKFTAWFMRMLQTNIAQHPAVQQAAAQPGPGPHRVNPLGPVATWAIMMVTLGAGVFCGALTGWGMPLNLAAEPLWLAIGIRVALGGSVGLAVAVTVMLAGTAIAMALTTPRK